MKAVYLKCKTCGGNIILTGKSHGICDSCGNECTLPATQDEKRIDMFNRGTYYRQRGDYDEAYSAFEHIIAEDNSDAEAHWNLVLCRYGIEYVEDTQNHTYLPTLHRSAETSILDDLDYRLAVEEADQMHTKELYERSAREIARIQEKYWEISRREKPYDVFICFKDREDEGGKRTESSAAALEIYDYLTEAGFRVFFSRVTLAGRAGEEFEPIIFAALNSARVMLLIANKREQLEARWVKNEWSRYIKLSAKDKSKTILPVFFDITRYDFPKEIPNLIQAIDLSEVDAKSNLLHAVRTLTGKLSSSGSNASEEILVSNLMKRVQQLMETEEYSEADTLLEQVLNREPENGAAYLLQLMIKCRRNRTEELAYVNLYIKDMPAFARAVRYGSEEQKNRLRELEHENRLYNRYLEAVADYESGKAAAALEKFETLKGYRDSDQYSTLCKKVITYSEILHQYQSEVGDGKDYITERIRKEHPDEYRKYLQLQDKVQKQKTAYLNYMESGKGFLIMAGIMLLSVILIFLGENNVAVQGAASWGVFIGTILIAVFVCRKFVDGLPKKIGAGIGIVFVLSLLETVSDWYIGIFMIAGIFWLCAGSFYYTHGGCYEHVLKKTKNYYQNTIQPLEEKIRTEVGQKYQMLDERFLVSLGGVKKEV